METPVTSSKRVAKKPNRLGSDVMIPNVKQASSLDEESRPNIYDLPASQDN